MALAEVMVVILEVDITAEAAQPTVMFVGNGTLLNAHLRIVGCGTVVGHVITKASQASSTRRHLMTTVGIEVGGISRFSSVSLSGPQQASGRVRWTTNDYIDAHNAVVKSGKHNYLGCKIQIPTAIRHDRIREALGNHATPEELKVISLLKYGMPLDCKSNFGIKKPQKNHHSAVAFSQDIEAYLGKSQDSQAI